MEAIVFYLLILQKIYQFKANDSEIKKYPLCLGNISGGFSANNMKKKKKKKKKKGLNRCAYEFSVDYKTIGTSDIIEIHKYLMKKHGIK